MRILFKTNREQSFRIVKNKKNLLLSSHIIRNTDTSNILSKESLETIIQEYTRISNSIWYKFSKNINITKHSKV